jgi:hypothetical protein
MNFFQKSEMRFGGILNIILFFQGILNFTRTLVAQNNLDFRCGFYLWSKWRKRVIEYISEEK